MNVVKHLFALGILVSPMAAAQAVESQSPDSNVADATLAVAVAPASVQVTYTNPDKFIDASAQRGTGGKEREQTFRQLTRHMEHLGAKYLKPGQTLKIDVLDLDRAGRVDWWNANAYDVRIMRDIDSPSMKVRYSLEDNGAVLASGEERMSDMNYLMGVSSLSSQDPLKYEKSMLEDWFRKHFGKNAHS